MHQVVRSLLIRAVQIYEGNEEALRSGQGRLANAYRTRWEDKNSAGAALSSLTILDMIATRSTPVASGRTPLETLAEVAHSRLPNDPDTSGADLGLPSGVIGARNDSSAIAAVGTRSEDTFTGLVQTPLPCEAAPVPMGMYRQNLQSPWPTNWPQQTSTHYNPLNGARSPPLFGFHQDRTIIGAGVVRLQDVSDPQASGSYNDTTTDMGGAQDGHSPGSAVRASGCQETNRTNYETSGQAYSPRWPQGAPIANFTYDQALDPSLAQLRNDIREYDSFSSWNNLVKNLYNDIGEDFDGQ